VAKISKLLHIMESGNAAQFKGKSLEQIDLDMDEIPEDGTPIGINLNENY